MADGLGSFIGQGWKGHTTLPPSFHWLELSHEAHLDTEMMSNGVYG